ncbi:LOW QUALITY PROTEIN: hypothetical protein N5P37_000177 [Trichoderma harzianum]|nr:LOW QUALITY PROTEIN: hypothetical protein N5P37_000177 [Trichoderma harzianum]
MSRAERTRKRDASVRESRHGLSSSEKSYDPLLWILPSMEISKAKTGPEHRDCDRGPNRATGIYEMKRTSALGRTHAASDQVDANLKGLTCTCRQPKINRNQWAR